MHSTKGQLLMKFVAFGLMLGALVLPSDPAKADRKIASVRGANAIRTEGDGPHITDEMKLKLNHARLDAFVVRYDRMKSGGDVSGDLESLFLADVALKERVRLRRELGTVAKWPELHREGNTLVFSQDGQELRVEWPHYYKPNLVINGLKWNYSRHDPVVEQINLLQRRLEYQAHNPTGAALWRLLLPESQAGPAAAVVKGASKIVTWISENGGKAVLATVVGTVVGTEVAGGMSSASENLRCGMWMGGTHWETEEGFCFDWRKRMDDSQKRLKERTGKFDAMENSKGAKTKETPALRWFPDPKQACLALADKSKNTYVMDFLEVDANDQPVGDWFSIVQKYLPDGKPDVFVTTEKGTDLNDPNWTKKATATLKFEDGHLTTLEYPNPNRDPLDSASPMTMKQDVTIDDTRLTVDQRTRRDRMLSMVTAINTWTTFCQQRAKLEDLRRRNVKLQKDKPSPQIDDKVQVDKLTNDSATSNAKSSSSGSPVAK